jgi:hypothetical protein
METINEQTEKRQDRLLDANSVELRCPDTTKLRVILNVSRRGEVRKGNRSKTRKYTTEPSQ